MSKANSPLYKAPSLGNVYFDENITQRPSQSGGIIGGGGDDPFKPTPQNEVESSLNVIPGTPNDAIVDVKVVPESDGTVTE